MIPIKYFVKLNIVSAVYGLALFIVTESLVNVYRISRLSGLDIGVVVKGSGIICLFVAILIGILVPLVANKWLGVRKLNYLSALLWIPYYILLVFMMISLFPMTDPGDDPGPGTGLVILALLFLYPLFLLLINWLGALWQKQK